MQATARPKVAVLALAGAALRSFSWQPIVGRLSSGALVPLRRPRLFAADMLICGVTFVFATLCRFGLMEQPLTQEQVSSILIAVPMFVVACAIVFPFSGLYSCNWKYASLPDLFRIAKTVIFASLVYIGMMFIGTRLAAIPRSAVLIEIFVLTCSLGALRLYFRIDQAAWLPRRTSLASAAFDFDNLVPVLLVGAGDNADLFLRALQRDRNSRYWPVGLIEGNLEERGLTVRGIPVLGTPDEIDIIVAQLDAKKQRPRHLIFTESLSRLDERVANDLIERSERLGIVVSRLPPQTELRNARAGDQIELRQIELTDLLERSQTVLDRSLMSEFLRGRRVAVTGAGGSIGSELVKQIASFKPVELVLLDLCELNLYTIDLELAELFPKLDRSAYICDVRQRPRVEEIFSRHRPEIVFHAAALKHVPMVEINPCEGILTNVLGSANVGEVARAFGARAMVQVSTDKVVDSTSVMGATKRVAELYCQALDLESVHASDETRFMTVRFGNVLGSSGSLIPLFKRQLARGGPLTVTHPEMTRYFMTIREAVELTLHASAYGLERNVGRGEIFVLDMGTPIRIMDIARRMIRLAGKTPDVDVSIKIVGCRPGEKLFEELFDSDETRVASPVPGVFSALPKAISKEVLVDAVSRLKVHSEAGDAHAALGVIAELLPRYRVSRSEPESKRQLAPT